LSTAVGVAPLRPVEIEPNKSDIVITFLGLFLSYQ
jgi:hypothetical protein